MHTIVKAQAFLAIPNSPTKGQMDISQSAPALTVVPHLSCIASCPVGSIAASASGASFFGTDLHPRLNSDQGTEIQVPWALIRARFPCTVGSRKVDPRAQKRDEPIPTELTSVGDMRPGAGYEGYIWVYEGRGGRFSSVPDQSREIEGCTVQRGTANAI